MNYLGVWMFWAYMLCNPGKKYMYVYTYAYVNENTSSDWE